MENITVAGSKTASAIVGRKPEITDEKILDTKEMNETPCYRTLGISYTFNLGNYESMKVNSEVRIPCTKEGLADSIDECFSHVKEGLDYITMKGFELRGRK